MSLPILTAQEMADADARSVAAGVPFAQLMEHAGDAVARFALRRLRPAGQPIVLVLCGRGHNGGDGLVAARRLAQLRPGLRVTALLLAAAESLHGDVAGAWHAAAAAGVDTREAADEAALRAAFAELAPSAALIVDAVLGTGFVPPLRPLAAAARALVNECAVPVLAVDLPSGWEADSTAQTSDTAFRADAVITFVAPKLAHVFGHLTGGTFGPVVVSRIGEPADVAQSTQGLSWAGASKQLTEAPRDVNGNKGRFGHVLVVGGAWGKSGAPAMASLAGLRAGAGLVTAAVPQSVLPIVAATTPELMCTGLALEHDGGLAMAQLEPAAIEALLKGIKVVAVGPGLGGEGTTPEFVRTLVARCTLPMVLDADGLNAFDASRTGLLREAAHATDAAGRRRVLVLTPHPGEMARLLGTTVKAVEADRVRVAREFATAHSVTLVLKGWRTLIAHPDGRVAVNTTGNPSMAKGGSGDILTGIVAAMLAQHPDSVAEAVEAAVFLHGLAGDFACLEQDEHTVLATDTVAHLARAFRSRVRDAQGFTWIAGTATNGTARRRR